MGGPVWKRINVVGPRVVNTLSVAGYGRSGPEKSWTVPSLPGISRNSVSSFYLQTAFLDILETQFADRN